MIWTLNNAFPVKLTGTDMKSDWQRSCGREHRDRLRNDDGGDRLTRRNDRYQLLSPRRPSRFPSSLSRVRRPRRQVRLTRRSRKFPASTRKSKSRKVAEGGLNSFVHRLPGVTKHSNLVLKRGYVTLDSTPGASGRRRPWVASLGTPIAPQTLNVNLLGAVGAAARHLDVLRGVAGEVGGRAR